MEAVEGCKVDEDSSNTNNQISICIDEYATKQDEVQSAKAEIIGVREENIKLKALLQQVEKDYKNLQTRFVSIVNRESVKGGSTSIPTSNGSPKYSHDDHDHDKEHELVSLRLGTVSSSPTGSKKDDITRSGTSNSSKSTSCENDELKLGLDYNQEKTGNTGRKEDVVEGDKWSPSKVAKTERSGDEEVSQTSVKRARVSVRARCDTPTMNDGCQWRKYGQKIAKGNPCPRAYYRCTVSPSCPVRKQVQRCVDDMSILITTYEGTHNHPLAASASAMASTTSAAAAMLLSGSTTSQPSSTITSLYGPPRPQPYFYPNASSAPFPTITLDLTTPPSTTSNGFNLYSSSFQTTPKIPTTSLSFGSMASNPVPWGNGGLSFGASPYNTSYQPLQFGKQTKEQNYQPYLEKFNQGSSQQALTETLTKAITSDPSFRSVIAAAISSMSVNSDKGESFGPTLKLGGHFPATDSNSLT